MVVWEIRGDGQFLAIRYTAEAAIRTAAQYRNRWDVVTIHEIVR